MSMIQKQSQKVGDQPLVSVIVPVYKVERYIHRCIDSLLKQTYTNLEIILIDDGSPDRCGAICDEYAKLDSRIKVIHQKNGGISAARNAGLDIASGEYIGFVDSDDYTEPDMYEILVTKIIENNADICVCQWQYEFSDGQRVVDLKKIDSSIYGKKTSVELAEYYYHGSYEDGVVCAMWNKIYKREIFFELHFSGCYVEEYRLQDIILSKNYNVFIVPNQLYIYVQNVDSLTNSLFSEKNLLFLDVLLERCNHYADNDYIQWNTRKRYCDMYVEYYYKAKHANIEMRDICDFSRILKSLIFNRNMKIKFLVRMILFRISPKLYGRLTKA